MQPLSDAAVRVIQGDCRAAIASLPDESVHAVITDPPYEIGFNGRSWDKEGIAFDATLWTDVLRVLKPGGYLLAFAAARNYHREATAIEEAGAIIQDSLVWLYGTGTPHSHDVTQGIDRRLGVEREVVGVAEGHDTSVTRPGFSGAAHSTVAGARRTYEVTAPTSEEARRWAGWGTRLKPSHEPIVAAQKPPQGTIADNLLAHGVGALNVSATRVGGSGGITHGEPGDHGRWPTNAVLTHLPECQASGPNHTETLCVDGCPVRLINEQAEGAARFFYVAKPKVRERIGGTVRNLHPTVKPVDLMRWLVRLVTPPGGIVLDPFLGSGSTGCAAVKEGCGFIGVERDLESYDVALARVSDWAFANGMPRPVREEIHGT